MNTLPANLETVSAVELFSEPEMLNKMIAQIAIVVEEHEPDISTEKGRKEIGSLAYQVSRSKTYIDDKGKEMVSEWKAKAKTVDAQRKHWRDSLDGMRDQIKKPLDDWQAAEDKRLEVHSEAIQQIDLIVSNALMAIESSQVSQAIKNLADHCKRDWQEFDDHAKEKITTAMETLTAKELEIKTREAEQKELEELRAANALREEADRKAKAALEKKEREDAIAQKAADDARVAAEETAAKEKALSEKRELEAKQATEAAERAAEDAKLREQRAIEQAAIDKSVAEKEAQTAAIEAEARAVEKATLAAYAERARIEAEKAAEVAAAAKREANKKHHAKINNEAKADFIEGGLSDDQAKLAVKLLAQKKIRHSVISY